MTFTGRETFNFEDYNGNIEQINTFGNITAEVVFAQVNAQNGVTLLSTVPAAPAVLPSPNPLYSIYSIYVSQSDFTGGITVAQLPTSDITGVPRTTLPTTPFAGSIVQLRVTGAQNQPNEPIVVTAPPNTGAALLGAVTQQVPVGGTPDNNEPLIQPVAIPAGFNRGVLPDDISQVGPGLTVASGQNLGNFYFGGTVMGTVQIGGAINNFYAGWLLTGNANGETSTNVVSDPQNFTVAGNIENLFTMGPIGTDETTAINAADYVSGFDMFVSGTIGTVHSFSGSIVGAINAANQTGVPTNGADQQEIEFINKTAGFDFFANDELGGSAVFNDDTYATAQYLSNDYNSTLNSDTDVVVDGTLQDDMTNLDAVDYYAVPLLAGQTITVQVVGTGLISSAIGSVQTGVFNPDGTEIASDYNRPADLATANQPFQFTTDRPGVYRFAVAPGIDISGNGGDSTFTGSVTRVGDLPYTLTISNVGHMAIGSIVAATSILDNPALNEAGFGAQSADIGAIIAGGAILSNDSAADPDESVSVENGSLRAIVGGSMGTGTAGTDPQISVPNGNVGLVETTSGELYFNSLNTMAIGGDYQVVSSAGNFLGNLIANGNIGTVRVQSAIPDAVRGNSVFQVDANGQSGNGTIDLIDDAGDLGASGFGGPSINVGPHGTLDYLHVVGAVYPNSVFGQSVDSTTATYPANTAVPIVEASGAVVTLTPVATTGVTAPALTVIPYQLDGGGEAIASVVSTGGLTVSVTGNVGDQAVGIGSIDIQGNGNTLTAPAAAYVLKQTFDGYTTVPVNGPSVLTTTQTPVNAVLSGNVELNVFDLTGGNFDQIANNTPGGEIVNVNAASIGTLSGSGPIGTNLYHSTAAALLPNTVVLNTFPFNNQRTGVVVSGSVGSISLASVGDLSIGGSINTISGTVKAPVFVTGDIGNVLIGSGIYPSGSGALSDAGIYADGAIGNVVGTNADIRGTVVSETGIQSIHLQNGSIINAEIAQIETISNTENIYEQGAVSQLQGGTVSRPILGIGSIVTNGSGGIIGSQVQAASVGVFSARNGFGIFNTGVDVPDAGVLGSTYADGYGLRGIAFFGGYNVGSVTANGDGSLVSTATFSGDVRQSETAQFDPYFGFEPNVATDIDLYLNLDSGGGVSASTPVVAGVTDTGVIENSSFESTHNLGSVNAWSIRTTAAEIAADVLTTFNFNGSIGSIVTTGPVDGLDVITGRLGTLNTGGDLMHTSLTIAGHISNLVVHANLTDDSSIIAHGRNGTIGNLRVYGNVNGLIEADGGTIGTVRIYGSLFGTVKAKYIGNLILYQNLGTGSLDVTGNAGTIQFVQDLGPAGSTLTVGGKLKNLIVGSNLTSNVTIGGGLGTLSVAGSIETGAKVTVGSVLQLLKVGADFQAGAVVQAHAVKKVKVRGANSGSIVIV